MFQRPTQAALFIDFDNVEKYGLADKIANWTAWIEDGNFDETRRKRKLLQKRVYWNSQHERHRDTFEANGYEAIMCPSRVNKGKSAADMIMALDALQLASDDRKVREFILLTTDTDFVPLFERLAGLSKDTVTLADPEKRIAFATYVDHADIVIPTFRIKEASTYQRRPLRLLGFWHRPPGPREQPARKAPARLPAGEPGPDDGTPGPAAPAPRRVGNVEAAAHMVAALLRQNSGSDISKQTITRALERKFGSVKASNWFGCGTYRDFINRAAALRSDLSVRPSTGGGISVRYKTPKKPKDKP
jgi:uncharacterized LabA/DUF88 family protein